MKVGEVDFNNRIQKGKKKKQKWSLCTSVALLLLCSYLSLSYDKLGINGEGDLLYPASPPLRPDSLPPPYFPLLSTLFLSVLLIILIALLIYYNFPLSATLSNAFPLIALSSPFYSLSSSPPSSPLLHPSFHSGGEEEERDLRRATSH